MSNPEPFHELPARVGSKVRQLRLQNGLTQEAVASGAGLASRHLQKIEAGEVNVTLGTLGKIAAALHVDVSEFFKRDEDPEMEP